MPTAINEDIAGRLGEVARILAEQGANRFRVQAYHQAAEVLRGLEIHFPRDAPDSFEVVSCKMSIQQSSERNEPLVAGRAESLVSCDNSRGNLTKIRGAVFSLETHLLFWGQRIR
jgi:hypothetical protein